MDGEEGFDPGSAVWKRSGWREVAALSARLARMRPLQRLIAELGRGTGLGPFRRGPVEVGFAGDMAGVRAGTWLGPVPSFAAEALKTGVAWTPCRRPSHGAAPAHAFPRSDPPAPMFNCLWACRCTTPGPRWA